MDASGRTMLQRDFTPETNQHHEEFEVGDLANRHVFSAGAYGRQTGNAQDGESGIKKIKQCLKTGGLSEKKSPVFYAV